MGRAGGCRERDVLRAVRRGRRCSAKMSWTTLVVVRLVLDTPRATFVVGTPFQRACFREKEFVLDVPALCGELVADRRQALRGQLGGG